MDIHVKENSFSMLPPPPEACQICAQKHEEELPHNRDSLYYQMWFHATYGRSPTWMDASLHCTEKLRQQLIAHLKKFNVPDPVIGLPETTDR